MYEGKTVEEMQKIVENYDAWGVALFSFGVALIAYGWTLTADPAVRSWDTCIGVLSLVLAARCVYRRRTAMKDLDNKVFWKNL